MIANELISQTLFPVQTSDTGEEVLQQMQVYHVRHLPIVNHEQLLGVISEDDILIHEIKEAIGTYRLSFLRPYVIENEHLFEVMTKMGRFQLTVIPVIDKEENYLGVITMEDLLQYFATHFSFADPGSIIVIESARGHYSLAEIARVAESEDITILSSFINSIPDTNRIYITLKLNRQDVAGFKATLERFGYEVSASFSEMEYHDGLKDRFDSLMSYLNI
ncbi:MAG: CBS domain-containing protein [Saprospiraceae bacterium]|nr:CBS domain-containing protein [Saprospiraceae bacterium]MBL0025144.1 CBS domain-containing protein [Saprospiraceae bacterium]